MKKDSSLVFPSEWLRVVEESGRGRYLVAQQFVPEGTVVWSEKAFACGIDTDFLRYGCSYCHSMFDPLGFLETAATRTMASDEESAYLEHSGLIYCASQPQSHAEESMHCVEAASKETGRVNCTECRRSYCDTECFRNGHADRECLLLSSWYEDPVTPLIHKDHQTVARLVLNGIAMGNVSKLLFLVSNEEAFSSEMRIAYSAVAQSVMRAVKACEMAHGALDVDENEVYQMCCHQHCNVFGAWVNFKVSVATNALFWSSLFNHSCFPNVVKEDAWGGLIRFHAVRDINAGDAVCISYVSVCDLQSVRQSELYRHYFFHCDCIRCRTLDENEDHEGLEQQKEANHWVRMHSCSCGGTYVPYANRPLSQVPRMHPAFRKLAAADAQHPAHPEESCPNVHQVVEGKDGVVRVTKEKLVSGYICHYCYSTTTVLAGERLCVASKPKSR
eukprot:ANDGO_05682.mRNA.1 SET domain-containing protein DDB_G0283443